MSELSRARRRQSQVSTVTPAEAQTESPFIEYSEAPKYKWVLRSDARFKTALELEAPIVHEYFSITVDGWVTARAGYAWDGATGGLDTKSILPGSVGHDIIYQAHQLGYKLPKDWKKHADAFLIRRCKDDGMMAPRRAWVQKFVEWFGRGRPRDINHLRQVYVAP